MALERAALARAAGAPADAVALIDSALPACPGLLALPTTIADRVEGLVVLSRRAEARALLAAPREVHRAEDEARLLVQTADLAREEGDLQAARTALERLLGLAVSPTMRIVARARLMRLDNPGDPARAATHLRPLVTAAPSVAAHAAVLAEMAEAFADADRFDEALARLDEALGLGPDAEAEIGPHRERIVGRWIDRLTETHDAAGVVTVYAAHRTLIDSRGSATDTAHVAAALEQVGLPTEALRLARLRGELADPRVTLALVEAALASGDTASAREALDRLARVPLTDDLVTRRQRAAVRLAIAEGDVETAGASLARTPDDVVRRDLVRAWMARGDAAVAREAWDEAAFAYEEARALAADGAQRAAAAGSLALALAARDADGEAAVSEIPLADDVLVRRATAALAATRPLGAALAALPAAAGPDDR